MLIQPDVPMPLPTPETQPFWDGLDASEIRVQRCPRCEKYVYYPRRFCPHGCMSDELEWVTLPNRGTVYSYSINHFSGSPAFEAPYGIALIDIAEGVRMLARIVDTDLSEIDVGSRVEAAFETLSDGDRDQRILCFRAAAAPNGDGR